MKIENGLRDQPHQERRMSLFVGIDVGTQGIKLLAYDAERRQVVATASAPLELISRDDGSREQQPAWWIDGLRACFAHWARRCARASRRSPSPDSSMASCR